MRNACVSQHPIMEMPRIGGEGCGFEVEFHDKTLCCNQSPYEKFCRDRGLQPFARLAEMTADATGDNVSEIPVKQRRITNEQST